MLTDWARRSFRWLLDPLARLLAQAGISPNALTIIGVTLHLGVAYILSTGSFFAGALALIAASCFDALDGALARYAGRVTRFGGFLDSTLDRYAESFVYFGLLVHFLRTDADLQVILIYATIVGSLLVSYTRARAEAIDVQCKEGLLTRVERAVVLILFLLIGQMEIGLWLLAVLVNFTAVQRIVAVYRKCEPWRSS